jgi:carboxypeptidase Taq
MPENALEDLRGRLAAISDLERVAGLLGWDQQTVMPPAGAQARANQRATIIGVAHERFVSTETGRLIEAAAELTDGLDYDSDDASLVRIAMRDYQKERRVPSELAAEMSASSTEAHEAWVEARRTSSFELFLPYLEKSVELRRRYLDCFDPAERPYDVLLDDYEPGATTAEVEGILAELRDGLVPLIAAVRERRDAVDAGMLHQHYPPEEQKAVVKAVLDAICFDDARWRLDEVVHPFAMSASVNDVRITTRYLEDFLPGGIFAAMHEFGHGLYESGVGEEHERSPVGRVTSLGLHESQSRLWENFVGRGRPFWQFFFPQLQAQFPKQLGDVSAEQFYRAVNRVEPSLIRVEADEATYNLHIILRFELEQAIVDGDVQLADLPEAWNARMAEYLGVGVPDDAHGVLQDPHWCFGFGYFPTYALGNLVAAQLWRKIEQDVPDLEDRLSKGDFTDLRGWLAGQIHALGGKLTLAETLDRVVGEPLSPGPYLDYLRSKLGDIYGLMPTAGRT